MTDPITDAHVSSQHVQAIRDAGEKDGTVSVQIGPRFLELFSANLYSSPNKAFEELVSNSWDAGATVVHVCIPSSVEEPDPAIWVLDNGESMDLAGLEQLWAVASPAKRDRPDPPRPQIGKFGIGKLATYILANEITYICRSADGVTRAVTMDYLDIDERAVSDNTTERLHIGALPLEVRRFTDQQTKALLSSLPRGAEIQALLDSDVPKPEGTTEFDDGFGGAHAEELSPANEGTWTLALLTNLKPDAQRVQPFQIRRMLRAALPLGASISIGVNGEAVESTKLDIPIHQEWSLGPNLDIDSLDVSDEEDDVQVDSGEAPYDHISIEGISGHITGTVLLYSERISGGKSADRARSVGFFVNVRGRVIALDDPYFGLDNLSHGAWAHFRCTVRADGLDSVLNVERDTLRDGPELRRFRALLRALFNKARVAYASLASAVWPNAGELLARKWDAFPLHDLNTMIAERLDTPLALPRFIDASEVVDTSAFLAQWAHFASENPGQLLSEVRDEDADPGASIAMFRLESRELAINANHPFIREHATTAEEKELVRDVALVDFLVATRMVQQGISPSTIEEIHQYRDQLMRVMARLRRRTGAQLAQLLSESTRHPRGLEVIVGDALEYLGYLVTRIGGNNNPEGLARAAITPRPADDPSRYSFTYDAKTKKKSPQRVAADDVNPGKLKRHRDRLGADYTLVVAPDFQDGALAIECNKYGVTPLRAEDLATLLLRSGRRGLIPLATLQSLFDHHDPDSAHDWVTELAIERDSPDVLTLDEVLIALEDLGHEGPDVLDCRTIANEIRKSRGSTDRPTGAEVQSVAQGFSVLLPGLLEVHGTDLYLSGAVDIIRQRIREMLDRLPQSLQAQFND